MPWCSDVFIVYILHTYIYPTCVGGRGRWIKHAFRRSRLTHRLLLHGWDLPRLASEKTHIPFRWKMFEFWLRTILMRTRMGVWGQMWLQTSFMFGNQYYYCYFLWVAVLYGFHSTIYWIDAANELRLWNTIFFLYLLYFFSRKSFPSKNVLNLEYFQEIGTPFVIKPILIVNYFRNTFIRCSCFWVPLS